MNDFVAMNSPWFLIDVFASNSKENKKPHILSHHYRNLKEHYYLIESAAQEVLIFRYSNLVHIANYLFTKGRGVRLISLLRNYDPYVDISATYVHDKFAHLVIIPKICLKPPCEEYTEIGVTKLGLHVSNFLKST